MSNLSILLVISIFGSFASSTILSHYRLAKLVEKGVLPISVICKQIQSLEQSPKYADLAKRVWEGVCDRKDLSFVESVIKCSQNQEIAKPIADTCEQQIDPQQPVCDETAKYYTCIDEGIGKACGENEADKIAAFLQELFMTLNPPPEVPSQCVQTVINACQKVETSN